MARNKKSLFEKIVPLGIPLAWLQLASESKRFAVALAGITFAVAMMLFQMGLQAALYKQVVGPLLLLDGQVMIVGSHYEYFGVGRGFANVRLHQALANPDVVEANSIKLGCASFKSVGDGRERDIFLIAFDPSRKVFLSKDICEQQNLLKNHGTVLFDSLSRSQYGDVGRLFESGGNVRTEIAGEKSDIVGLIEIGPTFAADGNVLMSLATLEKFWHSPSGVSDVGVLKLREGANPDEVAESLKKIFPQSVKVMTKDEFVKSEKAYWGKRTPIGFVIGASMAVAIFVGAVIVYQILYTDVSDHIPEYATLKAIGFADSFFVGIIVQESFILSFLGFIPGALLAELLYIMTREIAGMPTYMSLDSLLIVFGLSLSMCVFAGLLATRKLRKANPADIF
ncbi:MAG: ABC transporter permease DevC [Candidatus Merdousia sp.]|nr:ABC transporter permease DevC [Candidatus Merdousia sp.]